MAKREVVVRQTVSNRDSNNMNNRSRLRKHINSTNIPVSSFKINLIFLAITIASLGTRLYKIQEPPHVCWDETHFGKMASWYLNRTFFFDVHPPLGKMLIALSGHITGYNGTFAFDKPGDVYSDWTQYVGMRTFCATLGFLIAPMIFRSTKSMTNSLYSATIASLLIVLDNGMVTLSRYILLDPPLLFFISSSILGMAEFSFRLGPGFGKEDKSFSADWWFWLIWTGISISCAFSVKFVGLFIVVLLGFRTIYDLWLILGDTSQPISNFMKHFAARAICLIVLPIIVYVSLFWIHLKQLDHSGNGDGFYSSSFQSQLIGNSLHNSSWPAHLAYDAEVTIKNNRIGGAYLHSHWHLYPEGVGARQQQVTTYSHKDSNNKWLIKRGLNSREGDIFVRDGDVVLLEHVATRRNLHSHFEQAPVTKRHYQVTCYGDGGVGDANDYWRIQKEFPSSVAQAEDDRIYTVKTRFKLVHYLTNCALHSHSKQLPKWAYEQLEVTCNPKLFDKNNYWNIEDNFYPHLPNISFEHYAPSFIERFIESHAVMLQGNSALKPKEGEVTSRPWQWPINYKGQLFSVSGGQKIYLLGNPIIWWANIFTIPISLIIILTIAISRKLFHNPKLNTSKVHLEPASEHPIISTYQHVTTWLLIGWALHYIPFYFMGRVLYFHHYFPAFMFSCMQTAITFDYISHWICFRLKASFGEVKRRRIELLLIVISIVLYTFFKFLPLTYGILGGDSLEGRQNDTSDGWKREQQLSSLKWLDSWEF